MQLTTDDCFKIEKVVEQIGEHAREKVEAIVAEEATKTRDNADYAPSYFLSQKEIRVTFHRRYFKQFDRPT
ncbi:hypothetical protein COK81_32925 [Bacillus thuringiensis]|uniref:Uncharacterized protein n=1 Tax=Bacillus thuringiensis TaxID=1428 RepID=A0A9X7FYM8_BACTU|nr:hypothetical protein [Bacillus thuringiensis]PFT73080.1 hypothetical protein COK81_32925 [Bacillus thuringiensis]